jgi:hypothetical protein
MNDNLLRRILRCAHKRDIEQSVSTYIAVEENVPGVREIYVRDMSFLNKYQPALDPQMAASIRSGIAWKKYKPKEHYMILMTRPPNHVTVTFGIYPSATADLGGILDGQDLLPPEQTESSRTMPRPGAATSADLGKDSPL